jgi:hypothetical protein
MRTRSMKASSTNSIEIDRLKVTTEINENGQYEDNNILIKVSNKDSPKLSYLTEITKNKSLFIGRLNEQFKREGYGLNNFENGDKYFGNFEDDQRSKNGIYLWSPEIKNKKILNECYFGNWKNNKKEGNGIYIWLSEPNNKRTFDEANFEAFVGEFDDDMYRKGTYLIKEGDDYYLYHGLFDREGRKSDDNAYFYSSKNDSLVHGRVSRDVFRNGYIFIFDSNSGAISEMAYCNFDKEGNLIDSTYKTNLLKEDREKEEKKICNFRNIILNVDYFGYIYDKFKEIYHFVINEIDSCDDFESKEKIKKINKLINDYNTNNIYLDIEKNHSN